MTTGVLRLDSDLTRRGWMVEGLIQAQSKSFWNPMTGNSKDSIVYQVTDFNAKNGHTVVFDFTGNITGKAIKGKETAYGKGEEKRKFSDKLNVQRYRLVVDNGDEFDGVRIGDLSINQHSDSRAKLADLHVRWKDQMLFDAAQGTLIDETSNKIQAPSHIIDTGSDFTYNTLLKIEHILKTSNGYKGGASKIRRPLDPYSKTSAGPMWYMVIDSSMANKLRSDTDGYQTIVRSGDVRGENNRNIKGVIGKLGRLIIVEADTFFGDTEGAKSGWRLEQTEVEISGLRQYSGADPATAAWTGQDGFDYSSNNLHSRGLILGAGALQMALGRMPDYKFQASNDFGITSESACEFWTSARKCNLAIENSDYKQAKVANLDFGIVAVDVNVA